MTFFPIIELVDRLAIAILKYEKTQANREELDWYQAQIKNIDMLEIQKEFDQLLSIHREIWNLEKELKAGVEDRISLEEIGRRAIKIRNFNNQRVQLKNAIAKKLHCLVKEVKKDHISE